MADNQEMNTDAPQDTTQQHSSNLGNHGGEVPADQAAANSEKARRVYVGNLSYEVKWDSLKEFMAGGA